MPWLNSAAAKWELYELDERVEQIEPVDLRNSGNLHCQLVHAFNPNAALERFRSAVNHVLGLLRPGHRATTEVLLTSFIRRSRHSPPETAACWTCLRSRTADAWQ